MFEKQHGDEVASVSNYRKKSAGNEVIVEKKDSTPFLE